MRSRTTLGLAVLVLAVTAGCLGTSSATTGDDPGNATVDVSGSASVTAAPDQATVRLAVVGTADSADDARAAAAADTAAVRTALRDAGVANDAIETSGYRLGPVRSEERPGEYRAFHRLAVTVGPDRAGAVVDAAVTGGADRVDGVTFGLTEATRADLRADAVAAALERARADADALAAAAGVAVGDLRHAETGSTGYVPVRYGPEGATDGGTTDLSPGPVTVSATVHATYGVA